MRLGAPELAKYTYDRAPEDSLKLLGSARHGMQSGALAKLGDDFVLVVGDHVTPLSHADNKQLAAVTAHVKEIEPVFLFKAAPVSAVLRWWWSSSVGAFPYNSEWITSVSGTEPVQSDLTEVANIPECAAIFKPSRRLMAQWIARFIF